LQFRIFLYLINKTYIIMSSSLLWQLVKNNNCFKVSQTDATFSRDPSNHTGRQNFTDCGTSRLILGLVQKNAVVISTKLGDKKQVQFGLEFKKRQRFVQKTRKAG
jgi:hypothetical protein